MPAPETEHVFERKSLPKTRQVFLWKASDDILRRTKEIKKRDGNFMGESRRFDDALLARGQRSQVEVSQRRG
jgi:hypothetical protein